MTTTTSTPKLPREQLASLTVAVARRFPEQPLAHRAVRKWRDRKGQERVCATGRDAAEALDQRALVTIRPACAVDDPAVGPHHEVTGAYADSRGAIACTAPRCFPDATP